MQASGESSLVLIDLAAPQAAEAVKRAWDAGEAVALIDPRGPRTRFASLIEALRPTDLVDSSGRRHVPHGRPVPADVAAVVSTSGTTSDPRRVVLTRASMEASARAVASALAIVPGEDRWLACVPLHHVAGLAIVARSYFCDTAVTVHPSFDADAVSAASAQCSLVSLVPTMVRRLLDGGAPIGGFRRILVGGGPIAPSLLERAAEVGARVVTTYGLTETGGGCVYDGEPLAGVAVSISAEGEILVRGDVVMRGYHNDDAASREAFTEGGWLRTGDLGRFDSDGRLQVIDRLKDVIITGGVNVSPTAVEQALAAHPKVAEICVVGVPDDQWGERVVAFVVPLAGGDPLTLAELRSFGAESLGAPDLPRGLHHVESLPRLSGGKVARRELTIDATANS